MATEPVLVAGFMSGTSVDGIDVALIETDGFLIQRRVAFRTESYCTKFKQRVKSIFGSVAYNERIKQIENELTEAHYTALTNLCKAQNIEIDSIKLAAFHGQTIYHKSLLLADDKESEQKQNALSTDTDIVKGKNCETWQIGNARLLFEKLHIPVVYNLRYNDVLSGGQGAPLAPMYHAAIAITKLVEATMASSDTMQFPVAFVNIGGICNATVVDIQQTDTLQWNDLQRRLQENQHETVQQLYGHLVLQAFDVGPGNCLLDDWIEYATNGKYSYDEHGMFSMHGCTEQADIEHLVQQFMAHSYFRLKPPKSLDRNDLHAHLWNVLGMDPKNKCVHVPVARICSVAQIIAHCTCYGIVDQTTKYCSGSKIPQTWLISGGGRNNPFIMKQLQTYCNAHTKDKKEQIRVITTEQIGFNGDAIEAEAWAFLGARSKQRLFISTPSTTGVDEPVTGGEIIQ